MDGTIAGETNASNCNKGMPMITSNPKLSLRGTLAGDIYKRLQSSAHGADLFNILDDIFRSNPDDLVCISDGGMIIVGKKSDRGKFSPDW